ncbi:bidirectional sugar transporter SWEET2a-like isoform X1 [Juglans regia]|uniref:Bidirectional sugar transporter SWEET n=2 Tax=Juglans regia TaxID=51240 RepID=A0A2I4E980_JUGRE|nr:bidirectional sugar transporter SWEET2a-like isoform X1 [Juglans regia]
MKFPRRWKPHKIGRQVRSSLPIYTGLLGSHLCTKVQRCIEERELVFWTEVISGVEYHSKMLPSGLSSVSSVCSDAAGIAGNLFAIGLFVSPIPTFKRIIRNKSTEQFSGLPYIYALLNCLICLWYGMPLVSPNIILVATVNSIGAFFQLIYLSIYIAFAGKAIKLKMLGLLIAVAAIFGTTVYVSMRFFDSHDRQTFVGYLSVASLITMFASPLFIINLVIKTRSTEFMPFCLSLSTFLMSLSFFAYGVLKYDPFIYVPNGIGTILGLVQLALYSYYSGAFGEDSREPLVNPYA